MEPKKLLATFALVLVVLFTGCKKDTFVETPGVCPLVVSTDPVNAASNVALNKIITATFNENMNPVTVTPASFTVVQGAKGEVAIDGTVSCVGAVLTFAPTSALAPNVTYTGTLKRSIKDLNGNALQADYTWTFSTGSLPTVTSTDPANLAIGVLLNKVVAATFSVPMDPLTLTTTTFTVKQGANPVAGAVTYTGSTASFTPTADLLPATLYTATITTGAKNVPGTPIAANYVWTFTTATIPTVLTTDPANLATNVVLNKVIFANFSVAMDPLTLTATTFTVTQGATPVTGTISYTGTTASFIPSANLLPNLVYKATINIGAKSTLGIPMAADYVWTFTTGTLVAPTVILTDPADGDIGVLLNKVITATFSTPMDPLTFTAATFTVKQGVTTVAGAVTFTGSTASFTPSVDLIAGLLYTATITTGVKDVPGTAMANDFVWSFTSITSGAPTVTSTDPLNNATGVALNKIVSANFSVPMDPLTLTAATFTLKQGATAITGAVSYSGTTATFTPAANLTAGLVYTATVTTGAKNVLATAMAADYVWSFTTGALTAPTVTLTDPSNSATAVPFNKVLSATFSVPMDPTTITATTFTLKRGATAVAGTISYSGSVATFTPTSILLSGTVYTATITTGAKNLAATPLAANYVWTFTTVFTPPTVVSVIPLNSAINVPLNQAVSAVFSVPMNAATITGTTFTLMQGITPVAGAVTYSGSTATFTPSALLLSDATYTATVTTGAKNVAGTSLASNYIWTFNTVPHLGPLAPTLGGVARFGIIAGVGVSNNAGPSEIHDQDVGIYPGVRTSITGFSAVDGGPGLIFNGAFYASNDIAPPGVPAMLLAAQNDLTTAYNFAAGATLPAPQAAPADLGGKTLAPGIWTSATTMLLQTGNLTLDAQGDVNAVWIFQVGSAFTSVGSGPYPSASGGNVILAGGAQAKNIFWQVSSSATIGDYTSFYGTVMALSSITMNTGSTVTGRMLARNAAVVLTSTNIINKP